MEAVAGGEVDFVPEMTLVSPRVVSQPWPAMSLPPLRRLLPAGFLLAVVGSLVTNAPLYWRTAGGLGHWDILFGVLLGAPLLPALLWLVWNWRPSSEQQPRKRSKWAAISGVSLLGGALLVPMVRGNLATKELLRLGMEHIDVALPSTGPERWLEAQGFYLKPPNYWQWPSSSDSKFDIGDQASVDRVVLWLAICRTETLDFWSHPRLHDLHCFEQLRDLVCLGISASISDLDSDALGRMPKLRDVVIRQCTVRNLRTLAEAPSLKSLRVLECHDADFSNFPQCPHLEELHFYGSDLISLRGIERLPGLRRLQLEVAEITDFSALGAALPKLEELTIDQLLVLDDRRLSAPPIQWPAIFGLQKLRLINGRNLPNFESIASAMPNLESLGIEIRYSRVSFAGLGQLSKLRKFDSSKCRFDESTAEVEILRRIPEAILPDKLFQKLLPERWDAYFQARSAIEAERMKYSTPY